MQILYGPLIYHPVTVANKGLVTINRNCISWGVLHRSQSWIMLRGCWGWYLTNCFWSFYDWISVHSIGLRNFIFPYLPPKWQKVPFFFQKMSWVEYSSRFFWKSWNHGEKCPSCGFFSMLHPKISGMPKHVDDPASGSPFLGRLVELRSVSFKPTTGRQQKHRGYIFKWWYVFFSISGNSKAAEFSWKKTHTLKAVLSKNWFLICHDCHDQPWRLKLRQVQQPPTISKFIGVLLKLIIVFMVFQFQTFPRTLSVRNHGGDTANREMVHVSKMWPKTGLTEWHFIGSILFWSVHSKLKRWETL